MPQEQLFRLGADVHCADGHCGKIKTLVIDPREDAVTHLVVGPAHRHGLGKLVPLRLVDTGIGHTAKAEVQLRCTMAEFGELDPAETPHLIPAGEDYESHRREPVMAWPYYAPSGAMLAGTAVGPGDLGEITHVATVDAIPDQLPGEDEVSRGEQVHATDGDVGHIQGIVVDTASCRVTSVVLREGHLLGRRTVLIPREAVAEVGEDGFHLHITREQVQNLPSAG